MPVRLFVLLLTASLVAGCAAGRKAAEPEPVAEAPPSTPDSPFEPYAEVITDEAVTDDGVFTVHRDDDDLFFEIPDSLLGREMLLISRIAQTPANLGAFRSAGSKVAEQVVRWDRQGERVLLRKMSFDNVAGDTLPVAQSVRANNFEPILMAFDIEAISPDSAGVVIEVSDLFTNDVPALSGLARAERERYRVRRLDGSRTFIDTVKSFPLNLNVRHTMTYEATRPPSNSRTGAISMQMYQSMVLLPETPMRPRFEDPRVGYFSVEQIDFGSDEQKAATRSFIRRWRLEPSDPEAYARGELVEPVEPIVYYLDPATPAKWRPYFRQGVEDWNRAFEAAGFKNAIIARDAPTPEEDPDFDPEDVRYSMVRYVANTTRNAVGPSVSDPRSGEIIESDIIWFHNHIRSYRNRLLIETGAANPQARSLTIPDELIGETMRQVIAHEIGHAIGLPHNMIASSAFPVDSLRSPSFTERYGVAPSIMDYARQNYIAQPGDGVERFVRRIGPYDLYAVDWGYRVFPGADTPEAEKPLLDALILEHADDPRYRFQRQRGGLPVDPRAQTEDLGDDPVRASTYGEANLRRVVPNLIEWTSTPGRGYDDLEEIYRELLGQWYRYMSHVVTVVGGVYEDTKMTDQDGPVYLPVPRPEQEEAVRFLTEHVFETPMWLLEEDVLRRIEHAGAVDRVRAIQVRLLDNLLDPARMQRLIEAEAFAPMEAYTLLDFLDDVRDGVWTELGDRRPGIDLYRRNLQRGYLERMETLLDEEYEAPTSEFLWRTAVDVSQSDIRPFVRGQLVELRRRAAQGARRAIDRATQYHLEDVVVWIDRMLEQGN